MLSGGGARGAYEAGVISVLAPALERREQRPTIFLGTSVGAINAAYMGATRHLDAQEQAAGLLARWRQATKGNVIRPILLRQLPLSLLRYAGELLSVPGVRLPSLLDPTPLQHSLEDWMNWDDLHRNVTGGCCSGGCGGRDRLAHRPHSRVRRGRGRACDARFTCG